MAATNLFPVVLSDADLLDRANHTGTQLSSTISDFDSRAPNRLFATIADTLASVEAFADDATLVVFVGDHRYTVAASGATDHLLTTAGGEKLYVMSGADGEYHAAAMGLALDGTTDDSAKVEALGQYVIDTGGGTLVLPNGSMGWATRPEWQTKTDITYSNGSYDGFHIKGAGPGQTRCFLPDANVTGGIKVTRGSRPQTMSIEGVGFYSEQIKGSVVSRTNVFQNEPAGGTAAYWTVAGSGSRSLAASIADPYGITGNVIQVSATSYSNRVYKAFTSVAASNAEVWAGSVYVRAVTGTVNGTINLQASGGTAGSAAYTGIGTEWVRVESIGSADGTSTTRHIELWNWTGNIYVAFAQVEAGTEPSEYIPTTTASVTADVSTSLDTSGVGIWFASDWTPDNPTALGYGTEPHHNVTVRNCFVGSLKGQGFGRWSGGIKIDYAAYAQVEGNVIDTNHWNDVTDTLPFYETVDPDRGYSYGIDLQECYTPSVHGNKVNGRFKHGIRAYSDKASPSFEDIAIYDNIIDGSPEYGLVVEHTDSGYDATNALGEPGFRIFGNHINAHHVDARLNNIRHGVFANNFIHLTTDKTTWYLYPDEAALVLENVQGGQFTGNTFGELGHWTDVDNCTRSVVIGASCANLSFDANSHLHEGIAYDCSSATAMSCTFGPADTFGYRQGDGVVRYPEIYHYERTSVLQRVHAPPLNFSPTITIGGSSTGVTYTTRNGTMTRMGDVVHMSIGIELSSKGGLSGTVLIDDIPIAPYRLEAMPIGFVSGDTALTNRALRALFQLAGTVALKTTIDTTSTYADPALTGADITDTFRFEASMTYAIVAPRNPTRTG